METETSIIKTAPISLGSNGYYSLNVYKADGTEVVEKRIEDSGNVVTYEGAYQLFFGNNVMFSTMYANIGTGTSELTRTSVGLGNRFSAISSGADVGRAGNEVDNGDGTSTLTLTRTMSFSLGATTGTFSEVGISTSSNGSGFIAGQLIKDEFGNPTTITVLSDEQLKVTYTLELTVPNAEQGAKLIGTGSVTTPEGPVNYSVYAQPYFADYPIGKASTATRNTTRGMIYVRSAPTGNSQSYDVGTDSYSHNGSGVVTWTSAGGTVPPSGFSNTSIKYHLAGFAGSTGDSWTGVDPVTRLVASDGTPSIPVLVEYDTPINKDSTRSYKCQIEVVYNI